MTTLAAIVSVFLAVSYIVCGVVCSKVVLEYYRYGKVWQTPRQRVRVAMMISIVCWLWPFWCIWEIYFRE